MKLIQNEAPIPIECLKAGTVVYKVCKSMRVGPFLMATCYDGSLALVDLHNGELSPIDARDEFVVVDMHLRMGKS